MRLIRKNRIYFISLSVIIIALDQITKYLLNSSIQSVINIDFIIFRIDLVKNYGAAFNILSGNRIFLSLVSIIFSIALIYLISRKTITKTIDLYSYSFLLGGSIGNGIDRVINGYVIDFIKLNYINFPIFNIADISINIGFILVLYSFVRVKK